jgi:MFS family permease
LILYADIELMTEGSDVPRIQQTTGPAAEASSAAPASSRPAKPQNMRRVAWASAIGSAIEFYDLSIYGYAAALVFPHVFFPALGSAAAGIATFATLGVAFVARPVGSILFGHFGDRLGRKKTLIATLLAMGVATLLIGLLPTAQQVGIAAPILLIVLRIVQGLGAGGEWAGAALFASENAPADKRGFWAMMPSFGGSTALCFAPLTFIAIGWSMTDEQFQSYGWRIPFIASFVLVLIGLWIRQKMDETPVFTEEVERRGGVVRAPFIEALRHQGGRMLLAGGVMMLVPSVAYLGATYLTNYGTATLALPRNFVLTMSTLGGAALAVAVIVGGLWSDRIGRRRVVQIVAVVSTAWGLVLFPFINSGAELTFGIGVIFTMTVAGIGLGPISAYMSELFSTRYRYTAAGFSYNLGQIIGGATTPLLAAWMVPSFGSLVFSIYLACVCLAALACVTVLPETRARDLTTT